MVTCPQIWQWFYLRKSNLLALPTRLLSSPDSSSPLKIVELNFNNVSQILIYYNEDNANNITSNLPHLSAVTIEDPTLPSTYLCHSKQVELIGYNCLINRHIIVWHVDFHYNL